MNKLNNAERRNVLRSLMVGGGIAAASSASEMKWIKPVVNSVSIPVHAQSSGLSDGSFSGATDEGNTVTHNQSESLLDMVVPKAYAGGVATYDDVSTCLVVTSGQVTGGYVLYSPDSVVFEIVNTITIPGSSPLNNVPSSNVASGSIEVDGPGVNGAAGRVVLESTAGGTYIFPFDVDPAAGACTPP